MPLSWNEIRSRALTFSKEWADTEREEADSKPFLIEFLNIFGITQKRVATFEHKVKKLNEADGYIDMLWKGMLLIEMKSRGKDLNKAYIQAKEYCHGLKEYELPKLIVVSDFEYFQVYDETGLLTSFKLSDLPKNVRVFGSIAGYEQKVFKEQDPVNIEAAELMGKLHDKLKAIGYEGHPLELYLVRLLFCLFADDTGIFDKDILNDYIINKTNVDGSDLAAHIGQLFQILNTPEDKRLKALDESLAAFPYVNGKLFEENLPVAAFDSGMRKTLIDCCLLDWGKISPAIFGSLFQSVMDEKARRNLGAHYTSEKNILKLIKPLFLDELWKEFETVKGDKGKLSKLHQKISKLRFLDPACGCGNFLIIAYREIRLLELEIVKLLLKGQQVTSINDYFLVDVDQFYGIEYEEFPSQIAQVAMWLIDHQMNAIASDHFGEYYKRIPLKKSATIICGNALRTDWQSLIKPYPWEKHKARFHYIFGNPPFIGHQWRNDEQMKDMELVIGDAKRSGRLDYVAAWYIKSAAYLDSFQIDEKELPETKVAFVSTNSISQGEQVSILWNEMFNRYKIKIHFAHRTFKWSNEAKGNAGVHVVIIGFSNYDISEKAIFDYEDIKGEPQKIEVKNINGYLIDAKDIFIENRGKPIHQYPEMFKGSQPTDGGFLVLKKEDKEEILSKEPEAAKWIRPFWGSDEFLYNRERYCLWLKGISPTELKSFDEIVKRVEKVKENRLKSPTPSVREYSKYPTLFTQDRQPDSQYLAIPEVSSENRVYIPIGFLPEVIVCSNKLQIIPNASLYMFGVMQSLMHITWTKHVCGRLESRISYSPAVYNNFPWPENPSDKHKAAIEKAAQAVLDARAQFPESSLADLYDPNTMPPVLVKAHLSLDKAVDLSYRAQAFPNETKRITFLFELFDKYTGGLFVMEKKKKTKPK